MAPAYSSSFSVSVVLPASGWEMMAKVRRRATSRSSSVCSDASVSAFTTYYCTSLFPQGDVTDHLSRRQHVGGAAHRRAGPGELPHDMEAVLVGLGAQRARLGIHVKDQHAHLLLLPVDDLVHRHRDGVRAISTRD